MLTSDGASISNRILKTRGRRIFAAAGFAVTVSAFCLGYAYFIEPFRLVVNQKVVHVEGWEPEFDGFKAVLISDIHGGSRGGDAQSISKVVDIANQQDADAMFLLGDYVSTSAYDRSVKMPMAEIAGLLSGLKAKYGVFAVLGNHDGWIGTQYFVETLNNVGIQALDGRITFIERNGRRIRFLGLRDHQQVEDWERFSSDAKLMAADSEGSGPLIVLEHSPDVLPMITGDLAISNDLKLMFAGHTHGGQVWLPVFGSPIVPSSYGQKYAAGHIRDSNVDLFVTSGVGTSILPFRFLVPPEIMVVTIRNG